MEQLSKIRNFSIIAHIDHGKSTLADRMLELTSTIEKRKMKEQVLDQMELERERGITIKMTPVRMIYHPDGLQIEDEYILNLIDTPGHIDFSYEVSRALNAVEGVILLVDSTQGVQAQTLSVLDMARELELVIIPVLSKVDSPLTRIKEVKEEVVKLLDCDPDDVIETSGKTGEGVEKLLEVVIKKIPPPESKTDAEQDIKQPQSFRGLVFDFSYSDHKGVIVYIRVFDGKLEKGENLLFQATKEKFSAQEVGIFSPGREPTESLSAGEIGYIVTGIKKPGIVSVGDTITHTKNPLPVMSGYREPIPVVWASLYPEDADDFPILQSALERLRLTDSSLSFEEETSRILGRGFRCGFLGMLHLEIITERLRREFGLNLIVTTPSITYNIVHKGGKEEMIYSPHAFPEDGSIEEVLEPWVRLKIITPHEYMGALMQILPPHEGELGDTEDFGENRSLIHVKMPLRELMRGFFDKLKSATSGFASLSYEIAGMRKADVTRLDVLVADEVVPALSRVISKLRAHKEARMAVDKLYKILPRQLFTTKIQGRALGSILASKTLKALRKDVTAKLYGGDITRKMKLLEKQKKGKKKMKERGKVHIPQEIFLKMLKE